MLATDIYVACRHPGPRQIVPYLGSVCIACLAKLEKPTLYEGVISGAYVVRLLNSDPEAFVCVEQGTGNCHPAVWELRGES